REARSYPRRGTGSERLELVPEAVAVLRRLARARQPMGGSHVAIAPEAPVVRAGSSAAASQTIVSAPCPGVRSSGRMTRRKVGFEPATFGF
ncbi:MAG TPA: hypothetical protein VK546_01430, partial [Gaiellales bacterium]|nr:hypothetical protein [Gaiellales bacterium]